MPALRLGPLLRYVGETEAVFWVETDRPCEAEVLGARERTFCVAGHHYGLVRVQGLEPGEWHEYEVLLDGERCWPEPGSPFPPSRFRTYPKQGPLQVAFGSCRVCAPHEPPWTLSHEEDPLGVEVDALYALGHRMLGQEPDDWPDLLLMIGDQVYADELSPATRAYIESRRSLDEPPGARVNDFDEYAFLYGESWSEPTIRWLLSTVSSAMVFDDHDVHDDWNISDAWLEEVRSEPWWDSHISSGLGAYWIYQHVGNLAPGAHPEHELLRELQRHDDGWPLLRDFTRRADRETSGSRWSYCRELGGSRLVVIDSRAGRMLGEGRRAMVDDGEWDWIAEHATGGRDHLLMATSVPFLLAPGMHYAEAWSEAVAGGAWGRRAARAAERLRQALDLEHWAAFDGSFRRLAELQRSVAAGERGAPPSSIVTLSGDVHHAYLCEVAFPRGSGVRSTVWQAVCSPFRNPLDPSQCRKVEIGCSAPVRDVARALALSAGVDDPPIRWRMVDGGPWFDNVIGTLRIDGRRLELTIEKALSNGDGTRLEPLLRRRLA